MSGTQRTARKRKLIHASGRNNYEPHSWALSQRHRKSEAFLFANVLGNAVAVGEIVQSVTVTFHSMGAESGNAATDSIINATASPRTKTCPGCVSKLFLHLKFCQSLSPALMKPLQTAAQSSSTRWKHREQPRHPIAVLEQSPLVKKTIYYMFRS